MLFLANLNPITFNLITPISEIVLLKEAFCDLPDTKLGKLGKLSKLKNFHESSLGRED